MPGTNTYELCQQIIANGFLPDQHANYSLNNSAQMIKELNDCLTQNFERPVVNARQGYWLRNTEVTLTAGQARVRIPHRCAAGGLDRLEIADSATAQFTPLDAEPGRQSLPWEGARNSIGPVRRHEIRGEWIHLLPANDTAGKILRIWYYQRPSLLTRPQSPTLTGNLSVDPGVSRGRITSIAGIASRQVVVDVIPFRQRQSTPAAIVTAVDAVDIVKPNGWHELVLVQATQSISGTTITLGGTDSLADVEVGDYVRAADETDWAPLPDDFARLLADLASLTVCVQLGLMEKAAAYGDKASGDMDRFRDIIQPRNKDQAVSIDFPSHVLNGQIGRR